MGGVLGGSGARAGGLGPRTFLTAAERPASGVGFDGGAEEGPRSSGRDRIFDAAGLAAGAGFPVAGAVLSVDAVDAGGLPVAGAGVLVPPAGSDPGRDGDIIPPFQRLGAGRSLQCAHPASPPSILRRASGRCGTTGR